MGGCDRERSESRRQARIRTSSWFRASNVTNQTCRLKVSSKVVRESQDDTFLGLAEHDGGAHASRRVVIEKGLAEAPVKIFTKCAEAWSLKRTVLVADGAPAVHALMTVGETRLNGRDGQATLWFQVRWARRERAAVGAGFAPHMGGVDGATVPNDCGSELTSCAVRCAALWLESHSNHHLGRWFDTAQKTART